MIDYFPELEFSIERITIEARSRKLEATWCFEPDLEPDEVEVYVPDLLALKLIKGCTYFDWTKFHRATRKERYDMLCLNME